MKVKREERDSEGRERRNFKVDTEKESKNHNVENNVF